VEKNVFVVFYSGERAKNKILKICEAFGANRYPFHEDLGKQAQMINEVCVFLLGLLDIIMCKIAIPFFSHLGLSTYGFSFFFFLFFFFGGGGVGGTTMGV
jgi:hypothetical protein